MRVALRLLRDEIRQKISPQQIPQPPQQVVAKWLLDQHKVFTHGGNFWRDNYRLQYWYINIQPVVYRSDVYHGYKLLCRLGDWCWLTRDPKSGRYCTLKFLHRRPGGDAELQVHRYLVQQQGEEESTGCRISSRVATMVDEFEIPHHLAADDPDFRNIYFRAIVYPATGTDLRRLIEEDPDHLSLADKIHCIRDVVHGLSALHRLGVVHGDIHPGNVALPLPPEADLEALIAQPPTQDEIIRKDGKRTSPLLPSRVSEPISIGFSKGGPAVLLDLGYAFLAQQQAKSYGIGRFGDTVFGPPELYGTSAGTTTLPFKVDSWSLGRLIYFLATDGANLIDRIRDVAGGRQKIEMRLRAFQNDQDFHWEEAELPSKIKENLKRIIVALCELDPARRLAVADLEQDEWLMSGGGLVAGDTLGQED